MVSYNSVDLNSIEGDEFLLNSTSLRKERNDRKNGGVAVVAVKVLTAMVVLASFAMIASRSNMTMKSSSLDESTYSIDFSVASPIYGEPASITAGLLPWDAIVEPYRNNIFSVDSLTIGENIISEFSEDDYDITLVIDGQEIKHGQAFSVNATGAYDCTITIKEVSRRRLNDINTTPSTTSATGSTATSATGSAATSATGSTSSSGVSVTANTIPTALSPTTISVGAEYSQSFTIAVKYVRREIRSLTDDERNNFFDALHLLYTVDSATGKAKYGDKFNTAEYFVYKHLTGAGTTDCDHWHDGAGLTTHHMAFTLEIEQSLQAIDPSLSMPYWEYGMDTYLYDTWEDSPIFDADWFGANSASNEGHYIDDGGRWDRLKVPDGDAYSDWSISETGSLNPYVNGYSHMRGPWNNNPWQEVGRHNKTYNMQQYGSMPTCSTLQSCYKSTSLSDINDCLNGATHGPVHILIGGAWGEGNLFDDEDIEGAQMPDKLLFFKVLWRKGWTRCPSSCTKGVPCKCSVPDQYITDYGADYILKDTNVYYGLEKYLEDADDDLKLKFLRAVEDPGIAGEMFSSAAAFDPTFWPLHGAMERLVDLKRIYIEQGYFTTFDGTWGFVEYNKYSGAAYLDGVCDWSKVAGAGDLTLPTCTMDVTCYGHQENDQLEFSDFLGTGDTYTNAEFWEFMHPWTDSLPYTYDTFDFDYCDEQGYPFDTTESTTTTTLPMPTGTTDTLPSGTTTGTLPSGTLPAMQSGSSTGKTMNLMELTNSRGQMKSRPVRKAK